MARRQKEEPLRLPLKRTENNLSKKPFLAPLICTLLESIFLHLSKKQFFIFLIFLPVSVVSQVLEGTIFAAKDSTALQGVSVYFDGTSLGTTTNAAGHFTLITEQSTNIPIVISYLGYENVVVSNIAEDMRILPPIYLNEKSEELAEIVLAPDNWSREKKLSIFRREFLGNSVDALKVKIKNEDVLKLRYNPVEKVLVAEAQEPLIIINRYLGYEVKYDLQSFRVDFAQNASGLRMAGMVMYEGSSFFTELRKNGRGRFLRKRKSSYLGSPLHFMRVLSEGSLSQNNFQIFHKGFQVEPYKFFRIKKSGNITEVEQLTEKLSILYANIEQSGIEMTGKIEIDALGNHSPPLNVIFSGEMSNSRITHLLPLDYETD